MPRLVVVLVALAALAPVRALGQCTGTGAPTLGCPQTVFPGALFGVDVAIEVERPSGRPG